MEESLRVATGDLVREAVVSTAVVIRGFQLDDRCSFRAVLHDGRVVNRLKGLGDIVVDILHFNEDLHHGAERNRAAVLGVDGQPVVGLGLPVQDLCCTDIPCKTHKQ